MPPDQDLGVGACTGAAALPRRAALEGCLTAEPARAAGARAGGHACPDPQFSGGTCRACCAALCCCAGRATPPPAGLRRGPQVGLSLGVVGVGVDGSGRFGAASSLDSYVTVWSMEDYSTGGWVGVRVGGFCC